MLTWMQHHKKYLVITIWVSVIAFVGAGFVGWGAYDFNLNRSSSVAIVGNEKISFSEFSTRYNQIFNTYNQISNGNLSEENALEMGLDLLALSSLVEDKLLLSFAKDLGLSALESEILNELKNLSAFQDPQGNFDKNLYYEILKRNQISAKDFEESLAKGITIDKLANIFKIANSDEELKMLAASYFMQDSLNIDVLTNNNQNVDINEEEIKKLWNEHKEDYKMPKTYELSTFFVTADMKDYNDEELIKFYNDENNKFKYKDFNGKIMSFENAKEDVIKDYILDKTRPLANEKFLALKDKKIEFENNISIDENAVYYPLELLAKAKNDDILRPVIWNKDNDNIGYLIIKLNKSNPVRIKTYEEARSEILPIYISQSIKNKLEERAKQNLATFKGINIGFVTRDSTRDNEKVNSLNDAEFASLLMGVFNSEQNASYVVINNDKVALYRINKQKLQAQDNKIEQYQAMLTQALDNLKSSEIKNELIEELKKTYPIKIYYKGNQS
ncbi:peptidylprolyl isomerase [Campylobacter sp. LR185c]|uniref:peptidylprolyl isomerase n=1 Tax=Campylobacter sp. LR185c TaxID=2014525 RepID=UPI001237ACC2|nr:peptidylprolyl isomerase [Campylobacter sp. LR185c]KAA6228465.1 peptidylprolyl isomerase [Campylobacter sp. LR185c]KAA8603684.1 peptidylprolyl isomerase [Campylobacter sp. LR185c]